MSVLSRTIGDLDNREIAGKLNAASTLCLPFGSTEQHGLHVAMDNDIYTSQTLAETAAREAERHGLCAVAIEHRTGTVALSEPSVIVAASAPHRGEAFAGARALIDRVKAEAPIWKVEVGEDGTRTRVEGTLPS